MGGWQEEEVREVAESLLPFVERGKRKEASKRVTERMWRSEREKRGIRFHPGSSAVLLIEVGAHWGGETSQLESSCTNS